MKPGYTFCSYMTIEGHNTSKQGNFCFVLCHFILDIFKIYVNLVLWLLFIDYSIKLGMSRNIN